MTFSQPRDGSGSAIDASVVEPGRTQGLIRALLQHRLEALGLAVAVLAIIAALIGPIVAPYDPYEADFAARLQPPSVEHLLGTDPVGRDVLSRVLYGARLSLFADAAVIAFAAFVGTAIGTAAALTGGTLDEVLMRLVDIGLSFPSLVLAIGLAAALGAGLTAAVIALALTWWPTYARLARSLVLETKELEFVDGARSLGVTRTRLILRHILPNSIDGLYIQTTLDVATVTLVISGLSFIGVGAQPPEAEWGAMIADGKTYLISAWWVVVFPGLAILLTAVGFNLVGDLLREEFDPSLRLMSVR